MISLPEHNRKFFVSRYYTLKSIFSNIIFVFFINCVLCQYKNRGKPKMILENVIERDIQINDIPENLI